jgi:hypothetical protein
MIETGVGLQNPLFFVGAVENVLDPRREGRVQVRCFGVHGTHEDISSDELPWALVSKGDYDPNGSPGNGLPALNSWVFGVFLDGRDCQLPLVLGLIPTQYTEPMSAQMMQEQGWGKIPDKDGDLQARGSTPDDIGEPQNDRLARAERIEETYVLQQEMGRTLDVPIGGSEETWDEPASAYDAEYPYNRVIKTAKHVIELDDTPGSERIMIHHKSGSFIQIDSRGTTTQKTVSDKYDVMDRKQHVLVGGMSTVTILGNSYVYVQGNKIEEIEGDLQTLVHGNHMLSVGGQSTINASEQVQIRGADVKVQANVGTMSIKAGKELNISSGGLIGDPPKYGAISIKAEKIMVDATDKLHLRGNTQVNIQSVVEMNMSAITFNQLTTSFNLQSLLTTNISSGISTDISAGITLAIGSGVQTHIRAPFVYMDEFINMANGITFPPIPAVTLPKFIIPPVGQKPFIPGSGTPELAFSAAPVIAPEPVAKSTSIVPPAIPGSMGSSGFTSGDHGGEGGGTTPTPAQVTAATQTAVTPLLDFIGNKESRGYDDISGLVKQFRYPSKKITEMTIREVLDWQEDIDQFQLSEAVGRYQIMEDTLRGFNNDRALVGGTPLYTRAGLSAGDLFNPDNQDKMAIVLLEGRGLRRFLAGQITREEFADNLANEWASLPLVSGPNTGRSVYAGDRAGNRALTTVQEFLQAIDAVAAGYNVAP